MKQELLRLRADKLKIEQEQLLGNLIDVEETKSVLMRILNVLKGELMGLPGRLCHAVAHKEPTKVKEIIDVAVRTSLNNVADNLSKLSDSVISDSRN